MMVWQAVSAGADTDSSVLRKKVLTEITSQYLVKSPIRTLNPWFNPNAPHSSHVSFHETKFNDKFVSKGKQQSAIIRKMLYKILSWNKNSVKIFSAGNWNN